MDEFFKQLPRTPMRKSQASDVITVMCLQTGRLIAFQEVRLSAGMRSASGGETAHLLENLGDSKVVSFGRQEASGASILGAEQQWTSQNFRLVAPIPPCKEGMHSRLLGRQPQLITPENHGAAALLISP